MDESIRKQQNVWNAYSFDEERCFIKFYGVENFIREIDNYDDHQIKRKRKTDRSLETLGNYNNIELILPIQGWWNIGRRENSSSQSFEALFISF